MKAPTGSCYNYLVLGSLYYPEHDHYACPKHTSELARWEESKAHLLELIAPTVQAWCAHWLERGLTERDIAATFENLEDDFLEIVRPESEGD